MTREDRLALREELRVQLELYDKIIKRLQFEKMQLWQQQILNECEISKAEGKKDGESD